MTPQVIDHHSVRSLRLALRISAAVVGVFIAGVVAALPLGPQTIHMAVHIAVMNIAAPLVVTLTPVRRNRPAFFLWAAASLQILALWLAHAPAVMEVAMSSLVAAIALQAALFLSACLFWRALLSLPSGARWQAILALIISGKLACLLAALMIFSPRVLYTLATHAVHGAGGHPLADQQLAGLVMITACPLSYLLAATILCIQTVSGRMAQRDTAGTRPVSAAE